ncbi:MAG: DUF5691 domain-containing protein [Sandaracinaceae bacterium]
MSRDLDSFVAEKKGAWLVGRSLGHGVAPEAWAPALAGAASESEQELRLAALVSQRDQLVRRPSPPALRAREDLPEVPLALVPPSERPLVRRLLAGPAREGLDRLAVLRLLVERGYAPHPGDWLPGPSEEVPEELEPWRAWVALGGVGLDETAMSLERFEELSPGERRDRFRRLRARDPAAAAALLAQGGPELPAEQRYPLVAALADELSAEDLPLLRTFAKDRSRKARAAARRLLLRLGEAPEAEEEARELALMLRVTRRRSMLGTRITVTCTKPKNDAQGRLRAQLFGEVPYPALAEALEVAPLELAEAWAFGDAWLSDNAAFLATAAETAPRAAVLVLARRLAGAGLVRELEALRARLGPDDVAALGPSLLRGRAALTLRGLLAIVGGPRPWLDAEALESSAAMKEVRRALRALGSPAEEGPARDERFVLGSELFALGALLPHAAATAFLEEAIAAGLHPAVPHLDLLRLNVALGPKEDR